MNPGPLGADTGDKSDSSDSGMGSASSPDSAADPIQDAMGSAVCRDFLRHVCKRGRRCKYRHPAPDECQAMTRDTEIVFCHDFQNTGCQRPACKFLHCTREEEEQFKLSGSLPARLQSNPLTASLDMPPLCKDFLKGSCKRASKCKFRHLNAGEIEQDPAASEAFKRGALALCTFPDMSPSLPMPNPAQNQLDLFEMVKRRRLEFDLEQTTTLTLATPGGPLVPVPMTDWSGRCEARLLAEENAVLRRRLEELRKQCGDLLATNEVLLEQNARLRTASAKLQITPPTSIIPASLAVPASLDVLSYAQATGAVSVAVSTSAAVPTTGILTFTPASTQPLALS